MNGLTNIKRITALCVIAIMLLIPCVYAENETTDAAADMYGVRVEKLTALGLWPFEEKEAAAAVNRRGASLQLCGCAGGGVILSCGICR